MQISKKEFKTLNLMLGSDDSENVDLAMATISNLNFKENLVYISLLYFNHKNLDWDSDLNISKKLRLVYNIKLKQLRYEDIIKACILNDISNEHLEFIFENLIGYYIEGFKIEVKITEDES